MSEQCGLCKGDGWTVGVEHEPGCGWRDPETGYVYECSGVQVQEKCPRCDGTGREPEALAPPAKGDSDGK